MLRDSRAWARPKVAWTVEANGSRLSGRGRASPVGGRRVRFAHSIQICPSMLVNHVIIMHTLPVQLAGKCCVSSENNTLNIGPRIRRARLSKGLRMRDLAQVVGCDESMIS